MNNEDDRGETWLADDMPKGQEIVPRHSYDAEDDIIIRGQDEDSTHRISHVDRDAGVMASWIFDYDRHSHKTESEKFELTIFRDEYSQANTLAFFPGLDCLCAEFIAYQCLTLTDEEEALLDLQIDFLIKKKQVVLHLNNEL